MNMNKNYFTELWELQTIWGEEIFYKEVVDSETFVGLSSTVPIEYFNLVYPKVSNPKKLNIKEVESFFERIKEKPSIYLLDQHIKNGFVEYLVRLGFKFESRDTWMGFDKNTYLNNPIKSQITEVTPDNFYDFKTVLGEVFKDFTGNPRYLEICEKTLSGEMKNKVADLKSQFFLIYEGGRPVSGAAMFSSVKNNFAYLHNGGTLKEFRGKGYQSDLIRHRTNIALSMNINRIYAIVDHGGQSWSNFIKSGYNQMHMGVLVVKK